MSTDTQKKKIQKVDLSKLPFNTRSIDRKKLGKEISKDLEIMLNYFSECPGLKWCLSTIKKAKVFIIIYQNYISDKKTYKEEISKKLSEYSYKTIANIIDQGVERGYYVLYDPSSSSKRYDKKIKNLRPSQEIIDAFLEWNINRISSTANLLNKYK